MIKKIIVSILLFQASYIIAQQSTFSPYSVYGLGLEKFNGTNANRAMGGISTYSDAGAHNVLNPSTYADLRLTSFDVGASYTAANIKADGGTGKGAASTFDYLTIGIPAGKFGFGLGIVPYRTTGYDIFSSGTFEDGDTFDELLQGSGNLNRLFFAAGTELFKGLKLGAEFQYNFGRLEEQITLVTEETLFPSRFIDQSDVTGTSYRLSALYDFNLYKDVVVRSFIIYDGSGTIKTENFQERGILNNGFLSDEEEINLEDREIGLPTEVTIGFGVTKNNQWHFGTESYIRNSSDYTDRVRDREGVAYTNSFGMKVGGFYVPKFNSLTNYLNRITYRAGFRYDQLGLQINGEDINEFGMSFGFGLPLPREFSSLNIGFEAGSRGLITDSLVKENFYSISVGLTVSQKWFKKRKYN